MEIVFFPTPLDLQKWFRRNHATEQELWIGFYKKNSGKPSVTWLSQSIKRFAWGWIDGIWKSIDAEESASQFASLRGGAGVSGAQSISSASTKCAECNEERKSQSLGLAAFAARREYKSGIYSYEQRGEHLPNAYGQACCEGTRKPGSSSRLSRHSTAK